MTTLSKPLVVTLSHDLGKAGARARIERSLGQIRAQLGPFVTSIEDAWTGDHLTFRVVAMGQTVTGRIEVQDALVRIELVLPGLLGLLAGKIAGQLRQQGASLLEKPRV